MTCARFGRDQICTRVKAIFKPFGHGGSNPQVTGRRSQVAGRRSQVAGRRSQVAGRRSQVAGRRSQVAGRRSQVAGRRSQVAGRRSQVAGRRSQVAGRRSEITGYEFNQSSLNYFFLFPCSSRGKNKTCLLFKTRFSHILVINRFFLIVLYNI